jgi:hypothetical protein
MTRKILVPIDIENPGKLINVEMKRIDICDLILAVNAVRRESDAKKWYNLYELLKEQLKEFDAKHTEE